MDNKNHFFLRYRFLRSIILLIGDATAVLVTCHLINMIARLKHLQIFSLESSILLVSGFIITAEVSKLYHGSIFYPGFTLAPHEEIRRIFYIFLGFFSVYYFLRLQQANIVIGFAVTALHWGGFFFMILMVIITRWWARTLMKKLGVGLLPIIIAGAGNRGQVVANILNKSKHFGLLPLVFVDDDPERINRRIAGIPVAGKICDLPKIGRTYKCDHLIACLPFQVMLANMPSFIKNFRHVSVIGSSDTLSSEWLYLYDLHGMMVLDLHHNLKFGLYTLFQTAFHKLIAAFAVLVFLLPFIVIAVLVKLTSRGTIFYRSKRLGKDGREIEILKFRTMYTGSDQELPKLLEKRPDLKREWEEHFKLTNDPRITPLGRFLRKTSLDELPQLINVLKGDMNLIGPRPIVKDEVCLFGKEYHEIYSVKPGLTGMWQVSGRTETSYEERVLLETYYVKNWSIWLDIYILMKTILEVILCRGAY